MLGDTVCLMGDVPNIQLPGRHARRRAGHVRRLIDTVGQGGGLIMDSALMLDEARPDLAAMIDETKRYGIYRR